MDNNKTVINNTTIVKNVTIINNINNSRVVNNNVTNNTTNNVVNNHVNNVVYNMGPKVNEVENVTNTKIQRVTINEKAEAGSTILNANQLSVYRPVIKANVKVSANAPMPAKAEEYRRPN